MKKITISHILIFLAALAQGVMWINVFKQLHDGVWAYIGGIPAGLAIVGLVARGANVLPRVKSKQAQAWGKILLVVMIALEPVVLGVSNYMVMENKSYVVAGGASLIVSIALIFGAITDRSLVPATKPHSGAKRVATKPLSKKTEPVRAKCKYGCGAIISQTQNGYNGHRPKCTEQEKWPPKKKPSLAENWIEGATKK